MQLEELVVTVHEHPTDDCMFLNVQARLTCQVCHTQQLIEVPGADDAWVWGLDRTSQKPFDEISTYNTLRKGRTTWYCPGCGHTSGLNESSLQHLMSMLMLAQAEQAPWAVKAREMWMKEHLEGALYFQAYTDLGRIRNEWILKVCECVRCEDAREFGVPRLS